MKNKKIVFAGSINTGKTALRLFLTEEKRTLSNYSETIGVDFGVIKLSEDDRLQIWDLGGGPRFNRITSGYYRGAEEVYLFVNISDRTSLDWVEQWLANGPPSGMVDKASIFLIASKQDLEEKRQVGQEELEALQRKYKLKSIYNVSVENGDGLNEFKQALTKVGTVQADSTASTASAATEVDADSERKNQACREYLQTMLTELQEVLIPYKQSLLAKAQEGKKTGLLFSKDDAIISTEIAGLRALNGALIQLQLGEITHVGFAEAVRHTVGNVQNNAEHQEAFKKHGASAQVNGWRSKSKAEDFCDRLVAGAPTCMDTKGCCLQ